MTTQLLLRVIEEPGGPPLVRAMMVELAYLADRHGVIRYGQTEIAGRLGVSRQRVAEIMNAMCAVYLLEWERRGRYKFSKHFLSPEEDGEITGGNSWLEQVAQELRARRRGPQPIFDPEGQERTSAEADAELDRLRRTRQTGEAIYYTHQGWPILAPDRSI